MQSTIKNLKILVEQHRPSLRLLNEATVTFKPSEKKWSKKEILGHLVDSAQSNIRRFVIAQYEETPRIVYDQDKWVSMNNYQHGRYEDLVELWFLLNKQLVMILEKMPAEALQRTCQTGDVHSLQWLAEDYVTHLRHHLHHLLDLEPVPYP